MDTAVTDTLPSALHELTVTDTGTGPVVLLLGVGLSYALVYRDVWPTPEHRFAELERYNGRLVGEEKVLAGATAEVFLG